MSVFPRLRLFYRVFGCFSATGVQKHYKKRFTKKIVSKSFYKKFDQKSQTDFFSIFFLSPLWAFLDEGSPKTRYKKYRKNKSDTSPFSYSDPPTHHGGPRFFFLPAPWPPRRSAGIIEHRTPKPPPAADNKNLQVARNAGGARGAKSNCLAGLFFVFI
jgi:hypothetical protein